MTHTTLVRSPARFSLHGLACLAAFLMGAASPLVAAKAEDLLKPGKFIKHIRASTDQVTPLNTWVDSLRTAISEYQWEYGRRTNEGRLWQGFVPRLEDLHELQKSTRSRTNSYLDSIRSVLTPKQSERLNGILKKDDLLGYPVSELPFHQVSTSPLSPKFKEHTKAYRVAIPGETTDAARWSYRDLLDAWTVTQYVKLPVASSQGLTQAADVQVRADAPTLKSLIVRSPLILAATMMAPDLGASEFGILYEHYEHTFGSRDSAYSDYVASNKLDKDILIRLKMSTPINKYYLATNRYIIFLEDAQGTGYEPTTIDAFPIRMIEALEVRLPGQAVTYTDVFGTYTGQPGYKQTRWLSGPAKIQYAGLERLLKLYFPAKDFSGTPLVSSKTRKLKLIIQPELENLPRMEFTWDLNRKPKAQQ